MKLDIKGRRLEPADKPLKKKAGKGKTPAVEVAVETPEAAPEASEAAPAAVEAEIPKADTPTKKGKGKSKGPELVAAAPAAEDGVTPINKRITPGARVDEWRIARSLRVGKPGFFLQGGFIEKQNGKKFFRVAEEEYYKSLNAAKEALVAKYPAAAAVGEASEVS